MARRNSKGRPAPHVPRKKTSADEVYNIRRRLKRQAKKARREGRERDAANLEGLAAKTYAKKGAQDNRYSLAYVKTNVEHARQALRTYLNALERTEARLKREAKERSAFEKRGKQAAPFDGVTRILGTFDGPKQPPSPTEQAGVMDARGPEGDIGDTDTERGERELTKTERAALYGFTSDIWQGKVTRAEREEFLLRHFKEHGITSEAELYDFLAPQMPGAGEEESELDMQLEEHYFYGQAMSRVK